MVDAEYVGPKLPTWVKPGVKVRVKATSITRKYGVNPGGGDNQAWPGEIGEIMRRDGNGWFDFVVYFGPGRRMAVRPDILERLVRVTISRAVADQVDAAGGFEAEFEKFDFGV